MSQLSPRIEQGLHITRRHFLGSGSLGLGAAALALWNSTSHSIAAEATEAIKPGQNPFAPKSPHFDPKIKNVIYLHMAGSPPNLDLFDYKPQLNKRDGQDCPASFLQGKRFAFTSGTPKLLGSPRKFKQHGQGGAWFSDAVPKLAEIADDLTFVKSMFSDQFNHAPAELLAFTGNGQFGRPSFGSWVTYGIGSESENLPGFIVLVSGGANPSAGNALWSGGFLPSVYQGVQCRSEREPVLYVSNPAGMDRETRRLSLDVLRDLNELQAAELGSPETVTRIAQYEMAFRMQIAAPEVMDIQRESEETLTSYGAEPGKASFNNNCLLARRLVEKGVRFVQLHDWGWDFHGTNPSEDIRDGLTKKCAGMDQAVAALIQDLKQRGLLEQTLVLWGGEFGRTPFREGRTANTKVLGRDHHPHAFTIFMAGGGLKPGLTQGTSDELGLEVTGHPILWNDVQATLLHLLGLDHLRLTYRYSGRDFRLTDVKGEVIKGILA